jgi:hypothetical protein
MRLPVIRIIEILIKGAFLRCSLALWLIINHTELSLGYPHCYYVLLYALLGRARVSFNIPYAALNRN